MSSNTPATTSYEALPPDGTTNGVATPIAVGVDATTSPPPPPTTPTTTITSPMLDVAQYVNVSALMDLPSGYEMTVEYEGRLWSVQVPEGGVKSGQTFQAQLLDKKKLNVIEAEPFEIEKDSDIKNDTNYNNSNRNTSSASLRTGQQQQDGNIPMGHWRYGLFDCCSEDYEYTCGPCLFTFCFPFITLGQVMTRMNLNALAAKNTTKSSSSSSSCTKILYRRPFFVMLIITIYFSMYSVYDNVVSVNYSNTGNGYSSNGYYGNNAFDDYSPDGWYTNTALSPFAWILVGIGTVLRLYTLVVHTKTRTHIRRTYHIDDNDACIVDCCVAYWCTLCSICQMASHTADYSKQRYGCCTETGLEDDDDDDDNDEENGGKYYQDTSNYSPQVV